MPNVTWTRDLAAHLLRRAGFGATQEELDRYFAMGLQQAVSTLVDYESVSNADLDALLAQLNLDYSRGGQLQIWFAARMLNTARPLEEKMVFFWHNYFATSILKVKPEPMKAQIDLFRSMALGNFHDMIVAVSKDPAMLDWLDNRQNKVGHPNENYARELLELFSLGIGNYTETDIQEIARCFTGWTIRQDAYFFSAGTHDNGAKSFLGTSVAPGGGEGDGLRVCEVVAAHPATARYLARRLLEVFVYPDPSDATVQKFASVYTSSNGSVREVVRAILLSDEFWSDRALNATIKSPTEFVLGTLKALDATVDYRRLAADIAAMSQVLLAPPDVGGWNGDLEWINTTTSLARSNFGNALATNRTTQSPPRGHRVDVDALLAGEDFQKAKRLLDYMLERLGVTTLTKEEKKPLKKYLTLDDAGNKVEFTLDAKTKDEKVRGLIHLITSLPEYNLN